jgi:hypothetical protein
MQFAKTLCGKRVEQQIDGMAPLSDSALPIKCPGPRRGEGRVFPAELPLN